MGIREILEQTVSIVWPMGGVLSGSLFIAWATEVLSFFLSRGFAFALLAFLQVLPEFAVEAVITYQAGEGVAQGDLSGLALVSANFTGANRLIVGLFLPMVFFVAAARARKQGVKLRYVQMPRESSVEIFFLLVATLYSFVIPLKGTLTLVDAAILTALYGTYLWMVFKMPGHDEDEASLPRIPRKIRSYPVGQQKGMIALLFLAGGLLLFLSVEPFLHNTKELAALLGLSTYFLVQWLAPFLSEFPEFITILYWGRTGREQLGVTNAVSSKVNQWTLLLAMIPVVYLYATWQLTGTGHLAVPFDNPQRVEILLTAAQGLFAAMALFNLKFERWEAFWLVSLWGIQLLDPLMDHRIDTYLPALAWSPFGTGAYIREWFIFVYFGLCLFLLFRLRFRFEAVAAFKEMVRDHIVVRKPPTMIEPDA